MSSPLYHPLPNCVVTLITRADRDEANSGIDIWDDQITATPGDTTPGYNVVYTGEAGAFFRSRSRFVAGGDQGATRVHENRLTVARQVGQPEAGDQVTVRRGSETTTYTVADVEELPHPDCPLWRLYFREA